MNPLNKQKTNRDKFIHPFNIKMGIDFCIKNDDKMVFKIDLRLDSFVMELNHQSISEMKDLLNFMDNYLLAM